MILRMSNRDTDSSIRKAQLKGVLPLLRSSIAIAVSQLHNVTKWSDIMEGWKKAGSQRRGAITKEQIEGIPMVLKGAKGDKRRPVSLVCHLDPQLPHFPSSPTDVKFSQFHFDSQLIRQNDMRGQRDISEIDRMAAGITTSRETLYSTAYISDDGGRSQLIIACKYSWYPPTWGWEMT